MNNLDIVNKWDSVGLMERLSIDKKHILAPLLEEMAGYILGLKLTDKDFGQDTIETIIFPTMYRIIDAGGKIEDIPHLYNDYVNFINDKKDEVIEFQKGYDFHIDIEAELTGMYVEKYLKEINMYNNYVLINEDGITIGELKDFLKNFKDDLILSDTIVKEGTTYSTRITELFLDKEGVGLISQMTRDELNKK